MSFIDKLLITSSLKHMINYKHHTFEWFVHLNNSRWNTFISKLWISNHAVNSYIQSPITGGRTVHIRTVHIQDCSYPDCSSQDYSSRGTVHLRGLFISGLFISGLFILKKFLLHFLWYVFLYILIYVYFVFFGVFFHYLIIFLIFFYSSTLTVSIYFPQNSCLVL